MYSPLLGEGPFGTYRPNASTSTSDDDDLALGGQFRIAGVDGRIDVAVHALGELEWRGEHVRIRHCVVCDGR